MTRVNGTSRNSNDGEDEREQNGHHSNNCDGITSDSFELDWVALLLCLGAPVPGERQRQTPSMDSLPHMKLTDQAHSPC